MCRRDSYHIDLNVPHDKWRENLDFVVVTDGKGGQTVYTLPQMCIRDSGRRKYMNSFKKVVPSQRRGLSMSSMYPLKRSAGIC